MCFLYWFFRWWKWWVSCTVKPRNSELQNNGKPCISGQFSNDQISTFELLNLKISRKPRNSRRMKSADEWQCLLKSINCGGNRIDNDLWLSWFGRLLSLDAALPHKRILSILWKIDSFQIINNPIHVRTAAKRHKTFRLTWHWVFKTLLATSSWAAERIVIKIMKIPFYIINFTFTLVIVILRGLLLTVPPG